MSDTTSVTPQEFRAALGRFASGVTVITVNTPGGEIHGMTASSFCSVSLRPPLVLVCIDHLAETYLHVRERGRFGVSVLKEEQEALSEFFADPERDPDAARRLAIHYSQMKVVPPSSPRLWQPLIALSCRLMLPVTTPSLLLKWKKLPSPKGPLSCTFVAAMRPRGNPETSCAVGLRFLVIEVRQVTECAILRDTYLDDLFRVQSPFRVTQSYKTAVVL